jgi:hypothetical protein
LRDLNVASVRFVVNRVKRAQLDPNSWRPVGEPGLGSGNIDAAIRRALADSDKQDANARVSSRKGASPSANAEPTQKTTTPTTALAVVKRPAADSAWRNPGVPPWLADALTELDAEAQKQMAAAEEAKALAQDANSSDGGTESALTGHDRRPIGERLNGRASRPGDPGTNLFAMDSKRSPQADEAPAAGAPLATSAKLLGKKPSRLSELRGMVSAERLRALSQDAEGGRTQAPLPEALIEALTEAPARLSNLKDLVTAADLKELNQASAELTDVSVPRIVEAIPPAKPSEKPPTDQLPQPTPKGVNAAQQDSTLTVTEKPDAEMPKSVEPVRREERSKFDDVQILPSKRGQYRRKK